MVQTLFIGIFFIFIIILSIVMFFVNKKDMWLQMLWIITFLIHLIFLVFFTYSMTNIEMSMPQTFDRIMIDNARTDSNNITQDVITTSNFNHVSIFPTNAKEESLYQDADFCFMFNNSDGANAIRIVSSNNFISEYAYLPNNTVGQYCTHINASYVRNGYYLGVNCIDCLPGNTLGLRIDNNGVMGTAVKISASNPASFTIENHKPYLYWLEVRTPPYRDMNDYFFIYVWILGFLILAFALYFIVQVIIKGNKAVLE